MLLVNPINHSSILLVDHPPFYFQRRRQFAAFDRQFFIKKCDALYLFELREVLRARRDLPLKEIDDARIVTEIFMRAQVEPLEFGIRLKLFPLRYDQRRRESSLAADYHHLIDEARTLN